MSHGHLSKVERGEPGRPVTPAVLNAYEKATGFKLTGIAGHTREDADDGWRRGHLSQARRRTLRARVAAIAAGGDLGDRAAALLDKTGRLLTPDVIEETDVAQLEHVAAHAASLDMRYGGGVADQLARAQLRWAVGMLDSPVSEPVEPRLRAAVGALAQRAGWAAFDADSHDVARSLFTVALQAATDANEPNLRAHIIADFAAQANFLGYPDDCLYIVRHAEVDERIGPHTQLVIRNVKARAYALQGDEPACRRLVERAEQAQAEAQGEPVEGWLATVATAAQLHAGHRPCPRHACATHGLAGGAQRGADTARDSGGRARYHPPGTGNRPVPCAACGPALRGRRAG
jgi:hypothetical protein